MYNSGAEFMKLDKEAKNLHLDPKNENVGYVDIEGTRDFIKVNITIILKTKERNNINLNYVVKSRW